MPIDGQEDDDFAYEDEHIEMESDNQEYGDLDDREFDTRPALIRAELNSPTPPSSPAPLPDQKRAPAVPAPVQKAPPISAQAAPPKVTSVNSAPAPALRRTSPPPVERLR